jgi:hypothetical protein
MPRVSCRQSYAVPPIQQRKAYQLHLNDADFLKKNVLPRAAATALKNENGVSLA